MNPEMSAIWPSCPIAEDQTRQLAAQPGQYQ
jgi:hypothetical protein